MRIHADFLALMVKSSHSFYQYYIIGVRLGSDASDAPHVVFSD